MFLGPHKKAFFSVSRPHYQTQVKTKEYDICLPPSSRRRTPSPPPLPQRLPLSFPPSSRHRHLPQPGRAGRGRGGWGRLGCTQMPLLSPPRVPTQASLFGTTHASTGAATQGSGTRLRIEMAPRGGRDGPDILGFPPHPPPPSPCPLPLRGRRPRHRPSASPVYKPAFFSFSRPEPAGGSERRGVCDGAGVG